MGGERRGLTEGTPRVKKSPGVVRGRPGGGYSEPRATSCENPSEWQSPAQPCAWVLGRTALSCRLHEFRSVGEQHTF